MSEEKIKEGVAGVVRIYELLDRVRTRRDLDIRDDQFDFTVMLEAARYAGRRRIPLSLIDTGRLGLEEMESLAKAGARILTSDEARPRAAEWEILQRASRDGGTRLSVLWNGPLSEPEGAGAISLQALTDLLEKGVDFHVSNRTRPRDPARLAELAAAARKGRAFFVIYHAGPLAEGLAAPAAHRAWIHFSDGSIADGAAGAQAVVLAAAAAKAGSRAVVHIERGLGRELLEELWEAGAALLFRTPPSDDRSLLRPIERKAARRKLPARAYRISTAFLP
ncbi:MAG: hypothetical protein ABFD52_00505 [Acidobacteriota bacterium]